MQKICLIAAVEFIGMTVKKFYKNQEENATQGKNFLMLSS